MEIRLQKILAAAGVASRRKCEDIIAEGRVSVDGEIVSEPGAKVAETAEILVDGKKIKSEKKYYIMLNKPEGVVTTVSDPQGRPTVMGYVPQLLDFSLHVVRLFPVGRLDLDTSGLLFFTNDGDWANTLMHPSHELGKTYIAVVDGRITEKKLRTLRQGVNLNGRKTAPAEVEVRRRAATRKMQSFRLERRKQEEPDGPTTTSLRIKIHEGRKRQVRRMCEAVALPIISLKRVAIGTVWLGNLQPGKWRYMSTEEVKRLASEAGKTDA